MSNGKKDIKDTAREFEALLTKAALGEEVLAAVHRSGLMVPRQPPGRKAGAPVPKPAPAKVAPKPAAKPVQPKPPPPVQAEADLDDDPDDD